MNEHEELQNQLGEAITGFVSRNQNQQLMPADTAFSKINFAQWEVEPNDSYCPTGVTTDKLPPGIYSLYIDNYNRVHFTKSNLMTDKLVDLHDMSASYIIDGIRTFWLSEKKFKDRGLLYKRGILLWGPPGGGKTCLIAQLTRELIADGGMVIMCTHPLVTVTALAQIRRIEPNRKLIVIEEDIEEIMSEHGEHALLSLLDGENQIDNVVHIATTNYPSQLGARIINRPSRFDEVKKIGMPNELARRAYFMATIGKDDIETISLDSWVNDTDGMSIAHLKELVAAMFCLGRDYQETIERLKHMSIKPKDHEEGFKNGKDIGLANGRARTAKKPLSFTFNS